MNSKNTTYVAFLRGINVGGHHKVPMAELRAEMKSLDFINVETLLNSGNILFTSEKRTPAQLEHLIGTHLEDVFGFEIPTLVRRIEILQDLINDEPFQAVTVTQDTRLYVTFIRQQPDSGLQLSWASKDKPFRVIRIYPGMILSVLNISTSKTPKAMLALEELYGKDITTRNWNTILRLHKKLEA